MSRPNDKLDSLASVRPNVAESGKAETKQPLEKPKLTFVEPKLVKHGEVTELTGFFGAFSP